MIRRGRVVKRKITNFLQSALLITGMLGLLAAIGWALAGNDGLLWLMLLGSLFLLIGPKVSPRLVLRLHHARPISPYEAPGLFRIVRTLADRAQLPTPSLYYVPTRVVNAFAVGGRKDAALGLTDGLLRTLNQEELAGVLAHEVSHIRNSDLWVMGLANGVSRVTGTLSWIGQLMLLFNLPMLMLDAYQFPWLLVLLLIAAPTASALLQLALSRTREFEADLDAARFTGNPRGLAGALAKMERVQRGWLQRIFPVGRGVPSLSLFRTHPETEERIQRLLELEATPRPQPPRRQRYPYYLDEAMLRAIPTQVSPWRLSALSH